jgi:hypothetical protein
MDIEKLCSVVVTTAAVAIAVLIEQAAENIIKPHNLQQTTDDIDHCYILSRNGKNAVPKISQIMTKNNALNQAKKLYDTMNDSWAKSSHDVVCSQKPEPSAININIYHKNVFNTIYL